MDFLFSVIPISEDSSKDTVQYCMLKAKIKVTFERMEI